MNILFGIHHDHRVCTYFVSMGQNIAYLRIVKALCERALFRNLKLSG